MRIFLALLVDFLLDKKITHRDGCQRIFQGGIKTDEVEFFLQGFASSLLLLLDLNFVEAQLHLNWNLQMELGDSISSIELAQQTEIPMG
jgi:hypothetical protein